MKELFSPVGFVEWCDQHDQILHFYVLEHPSVTVRIPVPGLMAFGPAQLFLAADSPGWSSWPGTFPMG